MANDTVYIEDQYEVVGLKDYKSGRAVKIEANWNDAVKPGKIIKFTTPEGEAMLFDRAELQTIMFYFAPTEDELQYLRTSAVELKKQRHQFKIKAHQNIRKGDEVIISKDITI